MIPSTTAPFPRIRGGDPFGDITYNYEEDLFPAYAGVIPRLQESRRYWITFPRIRGGNPMSEAFFGKMHPFSPHTRG